MKRHGITDINDPFNKNKKASSTQLQIEEVMSGPVQCLEVTLMLM